MSEVNYQCSVVKLGTITNHPNADRLKLTTIFGNTVIVGLDSKEGNVGLFFPLESQIGEEFATKNDLIRRKDESGKTVGGLFDQNRRVRAQKLRGTPSMGFFCPLSYLETLGDISTLREGDSFNEWGGLTISTKYVPKTNPVRSGGGNGPIIRKPSRYIANQFKEHFDTEHLFRNIHKIPDGSLTVITSKLHGTSLRCGNVQVKRILSPLEKLCRFFGVKVQETEYDFIVGSRTVIKDSKAGDGYYKKDLWTEVSNSYFKDKLKKGEMIYAEVVGYVPGTQSLIQKGYTYGCPEGTCDVYVYRITNTNIDGETVDLSWEAIKHRCTELGVKYVPEMAKPEISDNSIKEMDEFFVKYIKETFLEKDEPLQPNMPSEGICVRVEGLNPSIYKAKSFRFLELETKQLDEQVVDMETEESVNNN